MLVIFIDERWNLREIKADMSQREQTLHVKLTSWDILEVAVCVT